MRILFLTERYPPHRGGLAKSARRIATGLAKRDIEVHVLVVDETVGAGDMESSEEGKLIIHRMGPFRQEDRTYMSLGLAVELLHGRHPFDSLVGMYLVMAGYIAAMEAKMLDIPSLALARGNDVDREIYRSSRHLYVMGALSMSSAVGCVSRELVKKCRALVNRDGIHYTPNSVDASVFTPGEPDEELRKKYGLGDLVVGFSGELRFKKGMTQFIAAAEQVADEFPGIKFLLLGGVRRDSEKEYLQLLKDVGTVRKPSLLVETPYIENPDELCRHYRLMDVLFLPSFWEGMPNACLEAFACGVPVVCSTAGGLADLIEPGVTGYSFTPGDFRGALDALNEALSLSSERRREFGRQARDRVSSEYTPKLEIDRILEIINGIL